MKAMIFAAGLGTRLKPLTDYLPKALVKVGNKPLLQHAIEKIKLAGISEIVINVHHFHEMVREVLEQNNNFGCTIYISDESETLLDTGGGLMKAAHLLLGNDPILLYNVDILCDIEILSLVQFHLNAKALATLAVRERNTQRYLLFDNQMRLTGWKNIVTGEIREAVKGASEISNQFAFSGIQVIDPELFNLITDKGKFSIIDTYLKLAGDWRIMGYPDHTPLWMDLGKPGQLEMANKMFG